ncbi:MAG: Ig-like domain-containing protein [Treponema sp.]|jgi:hypothetical protein|nr:Ig-like domain-containing protein [Treponema sp.]
MSPSMELKMRNPYPLLAVLFVLSCDLLRTGAFTVIGWSPGPDYHHEDGVEVSLVFSLEPDRVSVERSFSLSKNGSPLAGLFFWEGSKLIFKSLEPLEKNADYLISLGTGAQDTSGLSLERQFEGAFTTRPEAVRPLLLESSPHDGGILTEEREELRLLFSVPLDRASLGAFSFVPSVSGVWSTEDGGYRAVFTPSESWIAGKEYRLNAGTALASVAGLTTGREYTVHFSAGTDREPPELLSAGGVSAEGLPVLILSEAGVNSGWERNWKLVLNFSEPVDLAGTSGALGCDPSLGLVLVTPPGYGERAVFRFSETPVYGSSFVLSLGKGVKDRAGNESTSIRSWKIIHDGPNSKPPVFAGIRIPLEPGNSGEAPRTYSRTALLEDLPLSETYFPFDKAVPVWVELYFETAPLAVPLMFSLMDRFTISATNNALAFSPREFRTTNFTREEAAAGWETLTRVELRGMLTNRPYMGVITLEAASGLEDSSGNISAESFRVLLVK